jgi:hypothetical protein
VTRVRLLPGDGRARQRGSILSSLLIIVAFLSILVGALMTELTNSFLISRTLVARMQHEATLTSAVELGIGQLHSGVVPPVCARDARGPWFVTLNNSPAAVTETCMAIVPDLEGLLSPGAFNVDGLHDKVAGRDQYIVGDSSGRLRAYAFGQMVPAWSVAIGGPLTATPLSMLDEAGSAVLFVPEAMAGSGCGGHCVASFDDDGSAPSFQCSMPASSIVNTTPAAEVSATGSRNFPDYVFFGASGTAGRLYVYDAAATSRCAQLTSAALGGGAVGAPLVFPGTVTSDHNITTTRDEIFVLVSDGSNTSLEHWRYTETVDEASSTTFSLNQVDSLFLTNQIGGHAAGYSINSTLPVSGANLTLALAGVSGGMATVRISVGSGPSYTASLVASTMLPGGVSRPPYWCHCPGQDLIGVGSTNGVLYVLNTGLAVQWSYDGQADGRPAINSTPQADSNGDWYFGANDGYVYDVEIPITGQQMFKAARFGPGGAILSSPIVGGADDGCTPGACVYFASSSAGSYFARIGGTRIIDLRACISSASGATSCAANPRLWARVEIGSAAILGGRGVYVQGWSYYSP